MTAIKFRFWCSHLIPMTQADSSTSTLAKFLRERGYCQHMVTTDVRNLTPIITEKLFPVGRPLIRIATIVCNFIWLNEPFLSPYTWLIHPSVTVTVWLSSFGCLSNFFFLLLKLTRFTVLHSVHYTDKPMGLWKDVGGRWFIEPPPDRKNEVSNLSLPPSSSDSARSRATFSTSLIQQFVEEQCCLVYICITKKFIDQWTHYLDSEKLFL